MIERFESNGRFHQAVRHNGVLYLAGQTATEEGNDTVTKQTLGIFKKIEHLLEKYGSDKNHMLSAMVYLKSADTAGEFNKLWDEWVQEGTQPVRACVEAKMARDPILVEVCIVAAIKE